MPNDEQHQQIRKSKDFVRALIARAEHPAEARLDENELRRETGVSVRAMRAALNELAREGVLIRKRHVGTFISQHAPAAQSLTPPKLRTVGILSSRGPAFFTSDLFGSSVLRGLQHALSQPAQLTFFVHTSEMMSLDDLPPLDLDLMKRSCQGVVAIEAYHTGQLNELARSIPLTVIDYAPSGAGFDSVEIDHLQAGYQATRHLLSLGHRKVAFVGEGALAESMDPTWQLRLTGYCRAMLEAGVSVSPEMILDARRDSITTQRLMPDFYRRMKPDAFVLGSGTLLEACTKVWKDLGLRIPEQLSYATADSVVYEWEGRVVSQVRADYEVLGRQAVRTLAARLAARFMPSVKITIPVTFQPGQTSMAKA